MSSQPIITGAGLVGSLWAIYLRQLGFCPLVLEKRPDPRKSTKEGGRSINLVITSRGIRALETLELWEEIQKICVPVNGRAVHNLEGKTQFQAYGIDQSECNYSVSRSELNKLLIERGEKLGVDFLFSNELQDIDFEKQFLKLKDRSIPYEQVFACDGGASKIRQAMKRELSEFREQIDEADLEYKELFIPKYLGGELDLNSLHIWPRGKEMLMALPNLDGSFTVTLFAPKSRFQLIADSKSLLRYFNDYYPDAIALIPDLLESYFANPLGFLGSIRCSPWNHKGNTVLMGDAAHAILPFFGQGMNAGFEDCFYLSDFYKKFKDWEKTFDQFSRFQKKNADAICDMAEENYREMSDLVAQDLFIKKKKILAELEKNFPETFVSRYRMVCYTQIPYAEAQKIGQIQDQVLEKFLRDSPLPPSQEELNSLMDQIQNRLQ